MTRAAIVGAAGYAGAELTRLLLGHPDFDLVLVTSAADEGKRVSDLYPALAGCNLVYAPHDAAAVAAHAGVAFLAVPHTAAMAMAPLLLDAGLTVIDASADFRLRSPDLFAAWYATPHTAPDLIAEAVTSSITNKWVFLGVVNIFLLVVGMFMDIITATIIITPILLPMLAKFGINTLHFGLLMTVNLGIGYITPPVGVRRIWGSGPFRSRK